MKRIQLGGHDIMRSTKQENSFSAMTMTYRALHKWVEKSLGTPSECESCGATWQQRYEWANISGDYLEDTSDWARLCTLCHRLFDDQKVGVPKEECVRGHPLREDNLYLDPKGAGRCLACKRMLRKIQYQRFKREKTNAAN